VSVSSWTVNFGTAWGNGADLGILLGIMRGALAFAGAWLDAVIVSAEDEFAARMAAKDRVV
jgi:hypothetical protein